MNNSFIAIENVSLELDPPVDMTEVLRSKESELVQIIEALETVNESREWQILKDKLFNGVVENLMRQREVEIEKKPLNGPMIHSLNGQLAWAKRYLNIADLASIYKLELVNIRKKLNAT